MQIERDYYAILGVDKSATAKEIKRAHRLLVRRYHPDVSESQETVDRFHDIQEAYDILSDPEQREAYDRWRAEKGLDRKPRLLLHTMLSHQTLTCLDEEQIFYVLFQIRPAKDVEVHKLPLNLCLVLDRSTSMKGARLQKAKEATCYIIDCLSDEDIFSLVAFSDTAEVILPSSRSVDKNLAKSKVSAIRSFGGTEILQGLMAGINEVEKWSSPNLANHVVLLTDGQTYGDEEGCLEWSRDANRRGIGITALGIGPDWNDKLLDEMAVISGGASAYIDSPLKVGQVFRDKIHSLSNVFARDLSLTLRFGEGVRLKEAFMVSPEISRLRPREGDIPLGSLGLDMAGLFLLEVLILPKPPGRHNILQMEISGNILTPEPTKEKVWEKIALNFTSEPAPDEEVPSAIVSALGKLVIFKMQEKALADLEQGDVERATQRLETIATRLLNVGEVDLAKAALLEAGKLSRTGLLSPEGKKKLKYGTRSLAIIP